MPSFYFEQLLQNGLNGIDQQGITAAVLQIAGVVLVLSLLWGVYEAYSNGGDVRVLGVAAVKYLVLGLIFVNYQSAFRAVNSMFNGVADGIYNLSGGMDVIKAWGNSLSQAWNSNPSWFSALWNWATGGVSRRGSNGAIPDFRIIVRQIQSRDCPSRPETILPRPSDGRGMG